MSTTLDPTILLLALEGWAAKASSSGYIASSAAKSTLVDLQCDTGFGAIQATRLEGAVSDLRQLASELEALVSPLRETYPPLAGPTERPAIAAEIALGIDDIPF